MSDTLKMAVSKTKYVRISPYKLRRVANLIRGKEVQQAFAILKHLPHKGAEILTKSLKSAVANATHNHNFNQDVLIVSTLLVDEGPTMKRFQPKARGRIYKILKRTSHITVGVSGLGKGDQ